MSKQICFSHGGVNYVLEFTRRSVRTMEQNGFNINEVANKPMTLLPTLFKGAFLANHRFAKAEVIDAIYEKMTNRDDLIAKLVEMYHEPLQQLMDEPEENEGNVNWTASW